MFLSWAWLNSVGGDLKSSWIVAVVGTVGDVGVEDVAAAVAAAVSAVDRRDQLGMDSQSFVAISGCNLAWAGTRYFEPDGWPQDNPT